MVHKIPHKLGQEALANYGQVGQRALLVLVGAQLAAILPTIFLACEDGDVAVYGTFLGGLVEGAGGSDMGAASFCPVGFGEGDGGTSFYPVGQDHASGTFSLLGNTRNRTSCQD